MVLGLKMKDKLNLLERMDEQQRFRGISVYFGESSGQAQTQGYSYLYCRGLYQELGQVMGLDKSIAINERSVYGFNAGIKRKRI